MKRGISNFARSQNRCNSAVIFVHEKSLQHRYFHGFEITYCRKTKKFSDWMAHAAFADTKSLRLRVLKNGLGIK